MRKSLALFLLFACIGACSTEVFSQNTYTPPPAGTKSLVRNLSAMRSNNGGVIVSGNVLMPKGTKMIVSFYPLRAKDPNECAQDKVELDAGGNFTTQAFYSGAPLPEAGKHRVKLNSGLLIQGVQSKEVVALVGERGKNLPSTALFPDDKEFPKEGGHLQEVLTVAIPEAAPDVVAIHAVRNAVLFVEGYGQSSNPVYKAIQNFERLGGVWAKDWHAQKKADGNWTVTLDFENGSQHEKLTADWEYNPKTRRVKYANRYGKMLSWTPNY